MISLRGRTLLGALAGLAALGSGAAMASGSARQAPEAATTIVDHIRLHDADGAAIRIPRRYVLSCSGSDDRTAVLRLNVGGVGRTAHWSLEAPVLRLQRHPRLRLPEQLRAGAVLFAAAGGNEASSAEEEATGSLVFRRISCSNGPRLRLRVNARLGSEFFDGTRIRVTGAIRASAG